MAHAIRSAARLVVVIAMGAAGAGVAAEAARGGTPGEARAALATISPARATTPATRLARPEQPYELVVVGDSITSMAGPELKAALTGAGWNAWIDGRIFRSITNPFGPEYSGVDTTRALRADGYDAPVWLIALGTNDIATIAACRCADQVTAATDQIRLMLTAVGPARRVVWVVPEDLEFPSTSLAFEIALEHLERSGEIADLAPWRRISAAHHDDWFVDEVHLSDLGAQAWIASIVATVGTG